MRIILLLVITALLILISISCKKDAEITTNSDTTLILINDSEPNLFNKLDFLISVFIYNETTKNFELTNANLIVSGSKNDSLDISLEAKTTHVTIKDDTSKYTIKVTKQNYASYSATFTSEELKAKFDSPLIIVLRSAFATIIVSRQVAFNPDNGIDESMIYDQALTKNEIQLLYNEKYGQKFK